MHFMITTGKLNFKSLYILKSFNRYKHHQGWKLRFLVANASKNFALASRISQLVATFSHLATEKKGQSPVGAYLKKLISDPDHCMK